MDANALIVKLFSVVGKPVISLLFAVAFVVFVYGVFQFIAKRDDDKGREEGKNSIIYGILGMVIMLSVFGIIDIISGTIGIDDPTPPGFDENIFPNVNDSI